MSNEQIIAALKAAGEPGLAFVALIEAAEQDEAEVGAVWLEKIKIRQVLWEMAFDAVEPYVPPKQHAQAWQAVEEMLTDAQAMVAHQEVVTV